MTLRFGRQLLKSFKYFILLDCKAPRNLLQSWTSVQTYHTYIALVIFGIRKISCFCQNVYLNPIVNFQWKILLQSGGEQTTLLHISKVSIWPQQKITRRRSCSHNSQYAASFQELIKNVLPMSWFGEMGEGLAILYTIWRTQLTLPLCSTTTLQI